MYAIDGSHPGNHTDGFNNSPHTRDPADTLWCEYVYVYILDHLLITLTQTISAHVSQQTMQDADHIQLAAQPIPIGN